MWRADIAEGIGTFVLVLGVYWMAVNRLVARLSAAKANPR
jgi:hypothetical protein